VRPRIAAGYATGFQQNSKALSRKDWAICAALALGTVVWIAANFHASYVPVEDAAMLLRYARNFSEGFGIRWNIHQPPVDGATDFLYAVSIGALAHALHIGVIAASRMINFSAHVLSVMLVFLGARMLGGNRWLAAACAAYLAIGPAVPMTMGCFGAPFFALLLLGCWLAGLYYALHRPSWAVGFAMALLALLAGLTRPEGVIISMLFLAGTLYLARESAPPRSWIPVVVSYFAVFAVLGGWYFVWHWRYFGYPLPNPYYIKGNGHLYPYSVKAAAFNLGNLLAPALPLLPLGWLLPQTRRLANALLGVLIAFTLMWILLNDWNNAFMRFQYAIVPMVLVTLPVLATGAAAFFRTENFTRLSRSLLAFAGLLVFAATALYARRAFPPYQNTAHGMRDFANRLQPMAGKGYTILVTEAGTLPFYSEWQTIDGLGLNDRTMAHNGHKLTSAYLDKFHPEVLMVHVDNGAPAEIYRGELAGEPVPDGTPWGNMAFINYYGRSHGYTLAAAWGSDACNLHMYWVRPGFPDYDKVLSLIRQHPYIFLDNGSVSTDFRDNLAATQDCEHP
jgi:arabinofuranosyltransferase